MFGALLSLIVLLILAIYAEQKFTVMKEFSNNSYQEHVEIGVIPENTEFDYASTRFNFAFGLFPNNYVFANMPDASKYLDFEVLQVTISPQEDGTSIPVIE